jgi:hypothetical protein
MERDFCEARRTYKNLMYLDCEVFGINTYRPPSVVFLD